MTFFTLDRNAISCTFISCPTVMNGMPGHTLRCKGSEHALITNITESIAVEVIRGRLLFARHTF